jgi:hypothetical protein
VEDGLERHQLVRLVEDRREREVEKGRRGEGRGKEGKGRED